MGSRFFDLPSGYEISLSRKLFLLSVLLKFMVALYSRYVPKIYHTFMITGNNRYYRDILFSVE